MVHYGSEKRQHIEPRGSTPLVNTCCNNFAIARVKPSLRPERVVLDRSLPCEAGESFICKGLCTQCRAPCRAAQRGRGRVIDMPHDQSAAPRQPPTSLPRPIKDALAKARVSWLKNTEVSQLLSCHKALGFEVSQEAPDRPPSERCSQTGPAYQNFSAVVVRIQGLRFPQVAACSCSTGRLCGFFARMVAVGGKRQTAGPYARHTRSLRPVSSLNIRPLRSMIPVCYNLVSLFTGGKQGHA